MFEELLNFLCIYFILPIITGVISGYIIYKYEERKVNKLKNNFKNLVKSEMIRNIDVLKELREEICTNKNAIYGFPVKLSTIILKEAITDKTPIFNSDEFKELKEIYEIFDLLLNKNLWNNKNHFSKFIEIEDYDPQIAINNNKDIIKLISRILSKEQFIKSL